MRIGYYTAKLYEDNVDPQDIPECTTPINDTKAIGKVMKKWEKLHEKCVGCFECSESLVTKEMDFDNSLIVIKVDYAMRTEDLQKLHANILEQKKTGTIVLPSGCRATLAPKDIEIQMENGGGSYGPEESI